MTDQAGSELRVYAKEVQAFTEQKLNETYSQLQEFRRDLAASEGLKTALQADLAKLEGEKVARLEELEAIKAKIAKETGKFTEAQQATADRLAAVEVKAIAAQEQAEQAAQDARDAQRQAEATAAKAATLISGAVETLDEIAASLAEDLAAHRQTLIALKG